MKKTKQQCLQIICFLLMVVTCIFCLLPTKTWAAETKTYGDFKYCYNEEYEGIEILKYKGEAETVKIPESIEGIPVKVIGEWAFHKKNFDSKNKTMKKVVIPESVVVIEERAFEDCIALKSVNLPPNLQIMEEGVFADCKSLKTVNIPKNLKVLSDACFAHTGLKEVVIPNNIRKMEDAFAGCKKLKKVTFEKNSKLEFMGMQAFVGCDSLTSIKIPKSVVIFEQEVFRNCSNLKYVTFEKGSKLKEVGYASFQYCGNLTKITIPASVEILDQDVFRYCQRLKSITFEKGSRLKEIGLACFQHCGELTSVTIPKNVKRIKKNAFMNCYNLNKVSFKGSTPKISVGAFKNVRPDITFKVPKKYKTKYTKLLKGKKWYKDTMKIVAQ